MQHHYGLRETKGGREGLTEITMLHIFKVGIRKGGKKERESIKRFNMVNYCI
jgi:hypothetical protein